MAMTSTSDCATSQTFFPPSRFDRINGKLDFYAYKVSYHDFV